MADIAGSGYDDIVGAIMTLLVPNNHIPGEPTDSRFRTQNRISQGVPAPKTLVKTIMDCFFR